MEDANTGDELEALRQQTVLARFGELALRSDDLDELLTEACRLIGDGLGTDLAKVMELQADGKTLLVRAGVGWKPGVVGKVTVPLKDDTSEGYALKTGQPVISRDISTETRFTYPAFLIDNGVKAVANVLILGGRDAPPFGILQIDSRRPRLFDSNDIIFMRSYANLLAAAVNRLRSMQAARAGFERLRLVLDASELGSWELDLASGAATCSRRYNEIFGDVDPQPVWTIDVFLTHVVADDRADVANAFHQAMDAEEELRHEFRIRRASDGAIRWIEARGRTIGSWNATQPGHFLCLVADITGRKDAERALRRSNGMLEAEVAERTQALSEANARLRAEAAEREQIEGVLRQSQKMEAVGQLTGGIAHDFNNMLHAIGGSLELMGRRVQQGRVQEVAGFVDNAQRTVERAASLTSRLLAFARQHTLQPAPIRPDALIDGMAELIQRTVGPAIVVQEQTGNDVSLVLCDPHQLESALLNIAINARDAMPGGGNLTIGARDVTLREPDVAGQDGARPGNYVEITIADTGAGMDEATRMRAFEPFFTTKPIGKGTGLGLSQLYGFIRQSGGVVQLDSVRGEGTTVRLFLPRHEPARRDDAGSTVAVEPGAIAANTVVLLVEAEVQVRAVVAETLRELRYHVLEANDGATALQLLHGSLLPRVDLLVTEIRLSGSLNGQQIAEAARARRPALPVLFMIADTGGALDVPLAPGMAVIGKPFTLGSLASKVRGMIEAAAKGAPD